MGNHIKRYNAREAKRNAPGGKNYIAAQDSSTDNGNIPKVIDPSTQRGASRPRLDYTDTHIRGHATSLFAAGDSVPAFAPISPPDSADSLPQAARGLLNASQQQAPDSATTADLESAASLPEAKTPAHPNITKKRKAAAAFDEPSSRPVRSANTAGRHIAPRSQHAQQIAGDTANTNDAHTNDSASTTNEQNTNTPVSTTIDASTTDAAHQKNTEDTKASTTFGDVAKRFGNGAYWAADMAMMAGANYGSPICKAGLQSIDLVCQGFLAFLATIKTTLSQGNVASEPSTNTQLLATTTPAANLSLSTLNTAKSVQNTSTKRSGGCARPTSSTAHYVGGPLQPSHLNLRTAQGGPMAWLSGPQMSLGRPWTPFDHKAYHQASLADFRQRQAVAHLAQTIKLHTKPASIHGVTELDLSRKILAINRGGLRNTILTEEELIYVCEAMEDGSFSAPIADDASFARAKGLLADSVFARKRPNIHACIKASVAEYPEPMEGVEHHNTGGSSSPLKKSAVRKAPTPEPMEGVEHHNTSGSSSPLKKSAGRKAPAPTSGLNGTDKGTNKGTKKGTNKGKNKPSKRLK